MTLFTSVFFSALCIRVRLDNFTTRLITTNRAPSALMGVQTLDWVVQFRSVVVVVCTERMMNNLEKKITLIGIGTFTRLLITTPSGAGEESEIKVKKNPKGAGESSKTDRKSRTCAERENSEELEGLSECRSHRIERPKCMRGSFGAESVTRLNGIYPLAINRGLHLR